MNFGIKNFLPSVMAKKGLNRKFYIFKISDSILMLEVSLLLLWGLLTLFQYFPGFSNFETSSSDNIHSFLHDEIL